MGTSTESTMIERALVAGADVRARGAARGLAVREDVGLIAAEHGAELDEALVLCPCR